MNTHTIRAWKKRIN